MPMFTPDPPRDEDQWFESGVRSDRGDVTFVKPGEGASPVAGRTPENEGTGDRTEPREAATPVSPSKLVILSASPSRDNFFWRLFNGLTRR
jgi:hypothetical protein